MTEAEWLAGEDPARLLRWSTDVMVDPNSKAAQCEASRALSDRKARLLACAFYRSAPASKSIGRKAADDCEPWAETGVMPEGRDDMKQVGAVAHAKAALDWAAGWDREPVHLAGRAALLRDIVGNPFRPLNLLWRDGVLYQRVASKLLNERRRHATVTREDRYEPVPWLTSTVLSLAQAAYDERGRECLAPGCQDGFVTTHYGTASDPRWTKRRCDSCKGTNVIDDGTLDPARLAVLSDALEEAGCPAEERWTEKVRCGGEVEGRGNKGLGYYDHWKCRKCRATCLIAPQDPDGRCHRVTDVVMTRPHPLLAHLRSPGPHHRGCWAVDLILGKG